MEYQFLFTVVVLSLNTAGFSYICHQVLLAPSLYMLTFNIRDVNIVRNHKKEAIHLQWKSTFYKKNIQK